MDLGPDGRIIAPDGVEGLLQSSGRHLVETPEGDGLVRLTAYRAGPSFNRNVIGTAASSLSAAVFLGEASYRAGYGLLMSAWNTLSEETLAELLEES